MESSRNREQKADVCQTAVRPVQPSTGAVGGIQIGSLGSQDALALSKLSLIENFGGDRSRAQQRNWKAAFDPPAVIATIPTETLAT